MAYGEPAELEARYTPFNVEALQDTACDAVKAARRTSFNKLAEGNANKVFLLTFDTGAEAIARIPSPGIVGDAHAVTASEVQTMDYLRRFCEVKVPKVLSWSSDPQDNPVGAEYIVMERLPGIPLAERWVDIQGDDTVTVLTDALNTELRMARRPFSQNGSLYFKEDVSDEPRSVPLYYYVEANKEEEADIYRIGPSTNSLWWGGRRAQINVDRGPLHPDYPESQVKAAINLVRQLIENDTSYRSRLHDGVTVPDVLQLLDRCLVIAPYLLPVDAPSLREPILRHPNMDLRDIYVAPEGTPTVHGYLNLQGAQIAPRLMQSALPTFVQYLGDLEPELDEDDVPIKPSNYDQLTPEEQRALDVEYRHIRWQEAYISLSVNHDPHRTLAYAGYTELTTLAIAFVELILLLPSSNRATYQYLFDTVLGFHEIWQRNLPDHPLPLAFSSEELAANEVRRDRVERWIVACNKATRELDCTDDGWVSNERYDEAVKKLEVLRRNWDEEENGGLFPFQDERFLRLCLT